MRIGCKTHRGGSVGYARGANIVQKSSDMKEAVVDSNNYPGIVYVCTYVLILLENTHFASKTQLLFGDFHRGPMGMSST